VAHLAPGRLGHVWTRRRRPSPAHHPGRSGCLHAGGEIFYWLKLATSGLSIRSPSRWASRPATPTRILTTDDYVRRHGYAVGLSGSIEQTWVFFADLEPSLVFGRAGRMSSVDIRSYGVYHAVHEVRFDDQSDRDVRTLYVRRGSIDRQPDEHEAFTRWLAGTTSSSSHFQPPPTTGGRG
jgi:hypothetical protein